MTNWGVRGLAALGAAGLLLALPGGDAAAADGPIRFAATEVVLAGTGAQVQLVNDTGDTVPVTLAAELVQKDRLVPVAVRSAGTLDPAGTLLVTVPWPGLPAPATGQLTATAKVGGQTVVARVPLRTGPAALTPALDAWTVRSVRAGPDQVGPLPLTPQTQCPPAALAATTGGSDASGMLTDGAGHSAAVAASCEQDASGAVLRFGVPSLPHSGTYTGKLSVGGTDVALTVVRTWWWPAPALLVLLGWGIALVQQGWVDGRRRPARDRAARTALSARARSAQRDWRAATAGKPWAPYDLTAAVADVVAPSALPPRSGLRSWFQPLDEEKQAAAEKVTAETTALIEAWPAAGDRFAAAQETVEDVSRERAPLLVARYDEILTATGPVDAAELRSRLADLAAAGPYADAVTAIEAVQQRLDDLSDDVPDLPPADQETFRSAEQLYRQADAALRRCARPDDLDTDVLPPLQGAVTLTDRLTGTAPPRRGAVAEGLDPGPPGPAGIPALAVVGRRLLAGLRRRRIQVVDGVVLLVTLLFSLWAGLELLWAGAAWGGVVDALKALSWGYASTAVSGPILAAVRRLGERPGAAA